MVVENPLSGERITILGRRRGAEGDALVWELVLAPGGRVPSSHVHPNQQERFRVLEGELAFRLGWRTLRLGRGQSVTVPPGRVHHFANRGPAPTRVEVETAPALDMEALLRTAAAMAQDQHRTQKRIPRLADLALFMTEFEAEAAAPWLTAVTAFAARVVARTARVRGRDRHYRRLREPCGQSKQVSWPA